MTDTSAMFGAQAAVYDAARRRLIPPFDAFYGTAVAAVRLAGDRPRRILDLGAGTGILAARIQDAFPGAELTLLDGSAEMLERAELPARKVVQDLADPLPDGRFDAVVSALAIHHLDDAGKCDLFSRVLERLRPGGVFVNAEHVAGPTPSFTTVYERWHEREARAAGSDDAEWSAYEGRKAHDRCAGVDEQLGWLRDVGFAETDCLFKDHLFAVLVAVADGR